jgi:hypothetical protein
MRLLFALIANLCIACGGGSVYAVYPTASPTTKLPGIPFYPLEPVEVNTTTYDQAWAEMHMDVTSRSSAGVENTAHHVRYTTDLKYAASLYARFSSTPDAVMATHTAGAEFLSNTLSDSEPEQLAPKEMLKLKPVAVDRKRLQMVSLTPYYINSSVPFGGSGNAAVVLGADGSLTSASSQVSDTLPGAIVSTIGSLGSAAVSPLMTSVAGGLMPSTVTANSGVSTPVPLRVEMKFVIVHRVYTVTVSRKVEDGDSYCDIAFSLEEPLTAIPSCRVGLAVKVIRTDSTVPPAVAPMTITVAGPVTKVQ